MGVDHARIGKWFVIGSRVELQVFCTTPKAPRNRAADFLIIPGIRLERCPRGRSTINEKRFENAVLGAIDTGG